MIKVKREDYPAHTFRGVKYPARFTCRYFFEGREIANYDSKDDIIYLNSDLLDTLKDGTRNRDRARWDKPKFERALDCKYADAFKELFEMLGADETTQFSEFMNAY